MLYWKDCSMSRHNHGYTLVEVLVVVAIIAILAAFTVPTYQKNTTKSKMANVVPVLDVLMHDVLKNYATQGTVPTSLNGISGTGLGSYGSYVVPNVTTNMHYISGDEWDKDGAMITVTVPYVMGKGIPGFVESTNGNDGLYNSITMAFYEDNGAIILLCGRWDSTNDLYVPTEYLPSGCDNDNIQTIVTN